VVRDGETVTQRYQFPGTETCPACHAAAPGRVLGPRTEQLNTALRYEGETTPRDQLAVLAALDLFQMPDGALPALPDPADESLPIEQRARSYLHANCAHCHQPGGWSSPDLTMDLRYQLPLADAHICGEMPGFFTHGSALIAPGAPEDSAILIRMRELDLDRMPPVATTVVDPLGDEVVSRWISELPRCP
jgi:mono/diheme cytochrome c family protein